MDSVEATPDYLRGQEILHALYLEDSLEGGSAMMGGATGSREARVKVTELFRSLIKTVAGAGAAVATLGAGGDVVVNAVFAVSSSSAFMKNLTELVGDIVQAQALFRNLVTINMKNKIPIESKISLDDGFTTFEAKFIAIFADHTQKYGTRFLDNIYGSINKIIDRIILTISDWIACLFPDTAGLAGEAAKALLEEIVRNGYSLVYNLISLLPNNLQQLITNLYGLIDYIQQAIATLRRILLELSPKQIAEIITSLGATVSGMVESGFAKGVVGITSGTISGVAAAGAKIYSVSSSIGSKFSILPRPEEMMVNIIDRYITPNIDIGCLLFQKMFPLFLQFTLFIERYQTFRTGPRGGQVLALREEEQMVEDSSSSVI